MFRTGSPSLDAVVSLLALQLLLANNVQSEQVCAPYPIGLPLGDVKLGNTTARGVSLSVGEPEQPFAFLPQWYTSPTYSGHTHD